MKPIDHIIDDVIHNLKGLDPTKKKLRAKDFCRLLFSRDNLRLVYKSCHPHKDRPWESDASSVIINVTNAGSYRSASVSGESFDSVDYLCNHIKTTFRDIPRHQYCHAERILHNVLCYAKLGQLTHKSKLEGVEDGDSAE